MARCIKCLEDLNCALYFCGECRKELPYKYSMIQKVLFDRHIKLYYGKPYDKARKEMEEFGWENYVKLFKEWKTQERLSEEPYVVKYLAKIVRQISVMLRQVNKQKMCGPCNGSGMNAEFDRCKFCGGTGVENDRLVAIDEYYKNKEEQQRMKGWNW